MLAHPADNLGATHGAGLPRNFAAALEQNQRWNAADGEFGCDRLSSLCIQFCQAHVRLEHGSSCRILGRHHLAWAAPGGPEVDQHGDVAAADLAVKARGTEFGRMPAEKNLMALPALGCV